LSNSAEPFAAKGDRFHAGDEEEKDNAAERFEDWLLAAELLLLVALIGLTIYEAQTPTAVSRWIADAVAQVKDLLLLVVVFFRGKRMYTSRRNWRLGLKVNSQPSSEKQN
jgi:hypothetical protein